MMAWSFPLLFTSILMLSACARGPIGLKFGTESENDGKQSDQQMETTSGRFGDTLNGRIIGWDEVNQKVFSKYCLNCHLSKESPKLETLQDYRNALSKVEKSVVIEKTMPKRKGLNADEMALVKNWIANRAPQQGVDLNPTPEPTRPIDGQPSNQPPKPVTFQDLNQAFYEAKCTVCHYPKNEKKLNDYSTYELFRDNIGTILASTTIYITMPPPQNDEMVGEINPVQLSRAEKEMINRWILDGQKEK